jgi:hypothetical protein
MLLKRSAIQRTSRMQSVHASSLGSRNQPASRGRMSLLVARSIISLLSKGRDGKLCNNHVRPQLDPGRISGTGGDCAVGSSSFHPSSLGTGSRFPT